jgi:hypothetical protein
MRAEQQESQRLANLWGLQSFWNNQRSKRRALFSAAQSSIPQETESKEEIWPRLFPNSISLPGGTPC